MLKYFKYVVFVALFLLNLYMSIRYKFTLISVIALILCVGVIVYCAMDDFKSTK